MDGDYLAIGDPAQISEKRCEDLIPFLDESLPSQAGPKLTTKIQDRFIDRDRQRARLLPRNGQCGSHRLPFLMGITLTQGTEEQQSRPTRRKPTGWLAGSACGQGLGQTARSETIAVHDLMLLLNLRYLPPNISLQRNAR